MISKTHEGVHAYWRLWLTTDKHSILNKKTEWTPWLLLFGNILLTCQHQAITWANNDLFSTGLSETHSQEIQI